MSDDFDFDEGDEVIVRARENGTTGTIVAKFQATCIGFDSQVLGPGSDSARFQMPFGTMNSVTIRPYEAEFEVVD